MEYSKQQNDFFSAVLAQKDNLILEAVAGAGKTSTIVEACNLVKKQDPSQSIRFIAFNKSIIDELKTRIPAEVAEVGTTHSFCLQAWKQVAGRNVKIDAYGKQKMIIQKLEISREFTNFVTKLLDHARNAGAGILFPIESTEKMLGIVEKHDLDMEIGENHFQKGTYSQVLEGIEITKKALKYSIEIGYDIIDWVDMLYLPILHNVKFRQVDVLFVDEAQDLNALQRMAAKRMLKP